MRSDPASMWILSRMAASYDLPGHNPLLGSLMEKAGGQVMMF